MRERSIKTDAFFIRFSSFSFETNPLLCGLMNPSLFPNPQPLFPNPQSLHAQSLIPDPYSPIPNPYSLIPIP